jgi:hypothetical protein
MPGGRPKLTEEEKARRAEEKAAKPKGKPGRPKLTDEEKARRAEEKASKPKGKAGRPYITMAERMEELVSGEKALNEGYTAKVTSQLVRHMAVTHQIPQYVAFRREQRERETMGMEDKPSAVPLKPAVFKPRVTTEAVRRLAEERPGGAESAGWRDYRSYESIARKLKFRERGEVDPEDEAERLSRLAAYQRKHIADLARQREAYAAKK